MLVGAFAAAMALEFVGWWLLAVVAFGWGVMRRAGRWPALRIAAVVALLGAARLGWMAWRGAPVAEAGELVAALTTVPGLAVWAAAILVPALVALGAATLGVALGRKVLFG